MVHEETGDKYARATGWKGVGDDGAMSWLIKDMSDELKSWGHPGGQDGHIILKCDGERAIRAVRDALGKYHGGQVVPEHPAKGESSANGAVEQAGQAVRGLLRTCRMQTEMPTWSDYSR